MVPLTSSILLEERQVQGQVLLAHTQVAADDQNVARNLIAWMDGHGRGTHTDA